MAHEIDMSNNRANMAYAAGSATPWHRLGFAVDPSASTEEWAKQGGLGFTVERSPVLFQLPGSELQSYAGRDVLYRTDTNVALGLVTNRYKIVQCRDVMEFFKKIIDLGGFQMETVGSLYGGAKIWALAKINDGVNIVGLDRVVPYLMLGTSFDGTMATTATFTAVRVVCNNTIRMAVAEADEMETAGRSGVVKVPHSMTFDPENVRKQMGIHTTLWEQWVAKAQHMATLKLSGEDADEILVQILAKNEDADPADIRESKAYQSIMRLFAGQAIGSELTGGRTRWQLLNAVTEYVDHHAGVKQEARLRSAWFGSAADIKNKAQELLAA